MVLGGRKQAHISDGYCKPDTHLSPEASGDQYLFGGWLPPDDRRPVRRSRRRHSPAGRRRFAWRTRRRRFGRPGRLTTAHVVATHGRALPSVVPPALLPAWGRVPALSVRRQTTSLPEQTNKRTMRTAVTASPLLSDAAYLLPDTQKPAQSAYLCKRKLHTPKAEFRFIGVHELNNLWNPIIDLSVWCKALELRNKGKNKIILLFFIFILVRCILKWNYFTY